MLIGARTSLFNTKKTKPLYDSRIEYLQSTGTQYIDTGVSCDSDVGFKIKFSGLVPNNNGYGFVIGCQNDNYAKCVIIEDASESTYNCSAGTSVEIIDSPDISMNSIVEVSLYYKNSTDLVLIVDGNTKTVSGSIEPSIDVNLGLFSMITPDGVFDFVKARLYSVQITKGEEIVRDFIPVRVGTIGCLYDNIEGKLYYNHGTGDFICGQDIIPIEYIESTGTQYIDTGIIFDSNVGFSIDAEFLEVSEDGDIGTVIGVQDSNYYFGLSITEGNVFIDTIHGEESIEYSELPIKVKVNLNYLNDNQLSYEIGDILGSKSLGSLIQIPLLIYVFCSNNSELGYIENSIARIYSLKITKGTEIVRDFVPVRIDNVGCLYDNIESKLYYNQGSDNFILGSDKN